MTGVTATLAPLEQIRSAVISADEESRVDLYAGLLDPIRQTLSEMALLTNDAEDVRMRRAVLCSSSIRPDRWPPGRHSGCPTAGLISGLDPTGRGSAIAAGEGIRREPTRRPGAPLPADSVPKSPTWPSPPNHRRSKRTLERIVNATDVDATPQSWFAIATADIDLVLAEAMRLNDGARACSTGNLRCPTCGDDDDHPARCLVRDVLARRLERDHSQPGASQGNSEYRDLVNGLLRWFGHEALPSVDGLEMEVRYMPSATHAGAGETGTTCSSTPVATSPWLLAMSQVTVPRPWLTWRRCGTHSRTSPCRRGGAGPPTRDHRSDHRDHPIDHRVLRIDLCGHGWSPLQQGRAHPGHPSPSGWGGVASRRGLGRAGRDHVRRRTQRSLGDSRQGRSARHVHRWADRRARERDVYESLDELMTQITAHDGSLAGLADDLISSQPSRGAGG